MPDVRRPQIGPAELTEELRAAMAAAPRPAAVAAAPDHAELAEVIAALRNARAYAEIGRSDPPLARWHGALRRPARWAAQVVRYCSRFLTEPQAQVNLVALESLRVLAARLDNLERHTAAPAPRLPPPGLDELHGVMIDLFRGSRDDIRDRLRIYLPILRDLPPSLAALPALDLGCGRGEWLELLRAEGRRAQGVDGNAALAARCRALGLAVHEGDALRFLRAVPADSLAIVTAFHLVEHLRFDAIVDLVDQARRGLAPGGVLILETPDPQNSEVSGYTFHFDPTHHHPLPSPLLKFVVEARGLARVEVWPLHPAAAAAVAADGGAAQDYAIVAWKP